MAARKKQTKLVLLGKQLEYGLRRLRHGIRGVRSAAAILRAAGRVSAKTLARAAAGLNPPDVILYAGSDAMVASRDCLRCLNAISCGPLPPRRVWVIAPPDTMSAVRRGVAAGVPAAPCRRPPDLRFVEEPAWSDLSFLATLRTAVAASATSHVLICDVRAAICDDAVLWVAAVVERNGRCAADGIVAVYGDTASAPSSTIPWAAAAIDHKPDFSWTSLLAGSSLGPVVAFDRSLAVAAIDRLVSRGLATVSPGEALYALSLEALRSYADTDVAHVRHPLSVQHRDGFTTAGDDMARIASEALEAVGVSATVSTHPRDPSVHEFVLHPRRAPHVSIVIPTKNAGAIVKSCVNDLRERAGYEHYDITVIDHESDEPELLDYLARESSGDRLRVFPYRGPFNFAAMNNAAVRSTRGSLLLFLNNDVDGFSARWLEQMTATFEVDDRIGAVGALLHYPEGDIQHAGVVLNTKRLCQHAHYNWPADALGYQGRIHRLQEFSAVTGAMLLVRRDAFEAVGGFDEQFLDDYNDVDLCLRLRREGFGVVYQPHVRATHWEGRTRTEKGTAKDVFIDRWQHAFPCDPFYHPYLHATDFRPDGLGRLWRQRKIAALADELAARSVGGREQPSPQPRAAAA